MGVKKRYLKSKPVCKCVFELPAEAAKDSKDVYLVGDFNNWDTQSTAMNKLKSGKFKIELDLEVGKEYAYKFLIDGTTWENDWDAERYALDESVGTENSVVTV